MQDIPLALAKWHEAPRVRRLGGGSRHSDGRYVLCWLQQALRTHDNPVIDAAVRLGNAAGLPVLVYHGVREDYPYASDRLHRFILGASVDLASGCRDRGLAFAAHVERQGRREKGLVHRLGADAAAIVVEEPAELCRSMAGRAGGGARNGSRVCGECGVPGAAGADRGGRARAVALP